MKYSYFNGTQHSDLIHEYSAWILVKMYTVGYVSLITRTKTHEQKCSLEFFISSFCSLIQSVIKNLKIVSNCLMKYGGKPKNWFYQLRIFFDYLFSYFEDLSVHILEKNARPIWVELSYGLYSKAYFSNTKKKHLNS